MTDQATGAGRPIDEFADRSAFGDWFSGLLRARGLTRREVGLRIGVHPSNVSQWARHRIPNPPTCYALADVLGVPASEVLVMAGHLSSPEDLEEQDPTRARLIAIAQILDPATLRPHLEILEQTVALINATSHDQS